jgi:hypothetical protein
MDTTTYRVLKDFPAPFTQGQTGVTAAQLHAKDFDIGALIAAGYLQPEDGQVIDGGGTLLDIVE